MAVFLSRDRSAARDRAVDFLRDQALSGPDLSRRDLLSVRDRVDAMAVREVFKAEGLDRTSAVTLKILQDFAGGRNPGMKVGVPASQVQRSESPSRQSGLRKSDAKKVLTL